jgi:hypothetical protein
MSDGAVMPSLLIVYLSYLDCILSDDDDSDSDDLHHGSKLEVSSPKPLNNSHGVSEPNDMNSHFSKKKPLARKEKGREDIVFMPRPRLYY